MKEPYAESTVYQKYRKTGIDKNKIKAIKECLNACSNFYKVIELDEALMIVRRELHRENFKSRGVSSSGSKLNTSTVSKLNTDARQNTEARESSTDDVLTSSEINALVPIFERDSKLDFYLELESDLYDDGKDVLLLIDKEYLCVRNREFFEADILEFIKSRETGEPYDGPYPFEEDWDIFYELDGLRQDKGLFIPADLMKYTEPYFPETPQVKAMRNFLVGLELRGRKRKSRNRVQSVTGSGGVDNRSSDTAGKVESSRTDGGRTVDNRLGAADAMIYDMHTFIRDVHTPPSEAFPIVLNVMKAAGYKLSMSEIETCMELFTDLSNNTRMPCNGGYTPNELMKKMGRTRPGMSGSGIAGGSPQSMNTLMPSNTTTMAGSGGHNTTMQETMRESGGIDGGYLQSTSFGHVILEGIRNGEVDGHGLKQMIMGSEQFSMEEKATLLREIDVATEQERENDVSGGQKIGRNSPCPCGSGKKYKHCCGKLN